MPKRRKQKLKTNIELEFYHMLLFLFLGKTQNTPLKFGIFRFYTLKFQNFNCAP